MLDWTPSTYTQTINLPANRKGCDKSKTTYEKLSARRIQIFFDYFCKIHFFTSFFQITFPNNTRTKIVNADSDSSRRTLLCQGLRSFSDALVRWRIDFLVISVSQAEMRALDNIVLVRSSKILVRIHQFIV